MLDQVARQKQQVLSSNALGVNNENAKIKLQQKTDAQRALQGLYGTDTSAQLSAMGLVPGTIGQQVEAGKVRLAPEHTRNNFNPNGRR